MLEVNSQPLTSNSQGALFEHLAFKLPAASKYADSNWQIKRSRALGEFDPNIGAELPKIAKRNYGVMVTVVVRV